MRFTNLSSEFIFEMFMLIYSIIIASVAEIIRFKIDFNIFGILNEGDGAMG